MQYSSGSWKTMINPLVSVIIKLYCYRHDPSDQQVTWFPRLSGAVSINVVWILQNPFFSCALYFTNFASLASPRKFEYSSVAV